MPYNKYAARHVRLTDTIHENQRIIQSVTYRLQSLPSSMVLLLLLLTCPPNITNFTSGPVEATFLHCCLLSSAFPPCLFSHYLIRRFLVRPMLLLATSRLLFLDLMFRCPCALFSRLAFFFYNFLRLKLCSPWPFHPSIPYYFILSRCYPLFP